MSPDPAGMGAVDITNPQSINRYAYVLGNPLGLVDPTGIDMVITYTISCSQTSSIVTFSDTSDSNIMFSNNGATVCLNVPQFTFTPDPLSGGGGAGDGRGAPTKLPPTISAVSKRPSYFKQLLTETPICSGGGYWQPCIPAPLPSWSTLTNIGFSLGTAAAATRFYASVAVLVQGLGLQSAGAVSAVSGVVTAGAFKFGALSHYHLGCTP